jgi:hypothetical protein
MEIGWTDVGSRGYILVSCAHSNTSYLMSLDEFFFNIFAKKNTPLKNDISVQKDVSPKMFILFKGVQ